MGTSKGEVTCPRLHGLFIYPFSKYVVSSFVPDTILGTRYQKGTKRARKLTFYSGGQVINKKMQSVMLGSD